MLTDLHRDVQGRGRERLIYQAEVTDMNLGVERSRPNITVVWDMQCLPLFFPLKNCLFVCFYHHLKIERCRLELQVSSSWKNIDLATPSHYFDLKRWSETK